MKRLLPFLLAAPLCAQTYITAGDNTLTLTQLLHGHPEGMLLSLPSAQGQSLGSPLREALGQEPALALQLESQELELNQKLGRELQRLKGWNADKPHWALVGAGPQVYAEGSEAPTAAGLVEAYKQSPLHSRAETLRDFLKSNPGQREAQAALILELRNLGERRTEKLPSVESKPGEAAALLEEKQDALLWEEYADRYGRFMEDGAWLSPATDSSPIPLAAQLSSQANRSPRLRELAGRLLPAVESHLRDKLGDERRWKVWLSLRAAGGGGKASAVLAGAKPLPGALRWPPEAAVDAFVEDAQASGDWHEAEPVLQASFDQNEDLLRALEAAAREDAALKGGSSADLGAAFGFGQWNGETQLLVEAKLRLGKLDEADRIFRHVFARAPRPEFARAASELARQCGAEGLAEQWGALAK